MSVGAGGASNLDQPRRRRRAGWIVLAIMVAGLAAMTGSFAAFLSRVEDIEAAPRRHAQGAVALTGGADRISDAMELLAQGSADRLLITGVNPTTSRAEIAKLVPGTAALFGCCVELGYAAANTVGNAMETERWVRAHNIRSLIVVTSNYHMPRALAEIGSALPDVELIAYSVVSERGRSRPWWSDSQRTRLIMSEYVKYVATLVRLRLTPAQQPRTEQATT